MQPSFEQIVDGATPIERCQAALEPVVCRLLVDNMPAEAIIVAVGQSHRARR